MLYADEITDTFESEVLVQFKQTGGKVIQGSYWAEFYRLDQPTVDEMADWDDLRNSEIFEKTVKRVWDVGKSRTEAFAPDEAMAFVKKSGECVSAAVTVFFRSMRAERYVERTSRKQRKNG